MPDFLGDGCGDRILTAASPWLRSNNGCEVRKSANGWSLVATKHFGQGDVVLEECPVMRGPSTFPWNTPEELKKSLEGQDRCVRVSEWMFASHVAFPTHSEDLWIDVDFLTNELAMFAPLDSHAADSYRAELAKIMAPSQLSETLLRGLLMGKFSSFPYGDGSDGRCLFGLLSKLNHSCYPNTVCLWPGPVSAPSAQLRAVTRIQAGEELTFSYLGNDFPLRVRSTEKRRERLFRGFEFNCCCELCEAKEPKTTGQLCKRALAFGKPPPFPKSKKEVVGGGQ
ncbi:unnamed protein product [Durusdinium trenchii]|uniref:N-lysine methyltransferase SMYD2-B (Histone methyltransferase SMYD2-B) (SET and MYND domain-containing protein 2B) n=2 Tax=Durusdinium trenchii TaxID=1381693 RepID=A0ABP0K840_9DINO